jgi:hypothetical protein
MVIILEMLVFPWSGCLYMLLLAYLLFLLSGHSYLSFVGKYKLGILELQGRLWLLVSNSSQ